MILNSKILRDFNMEISKMEMNSRLCVLHQLLLMELLISLK